MSKVFSKMFRATKSLETVKSAKNLLPSFYGKANEKEGGIIWSMLRNPIELMIAFDLAPQYPENFGTLCAARLVSPKFIEIAGAEGFASDLCSYLTNSMGYLPTPS